jgi:hypothetical protein
MSTTETNRACSLGMRFPAPLQFSLDDFDICLGSGLAVLVGTVDRLVMRI